MTANLRISLNEGRGFYNLFTFNAKCRLSLAVFDGMRGKSRGRLLPESVAADTADRRQAATGAALPASQVQEEHTDQHQHQVDGLALHVLFTENQGTEKEGYHYTASPYH